MKTLTAASRVPVAPDFSALPVAAQSPPSAVALTHVNVVPMGSEGPDCSCGAG